MLCLHLSQRTHWPYGHTGPPPLTTAAHPFPHSMELEVPPSSLMMCFSYSYTDLGAARWAVRPFGPAISRNSLRIAITGTCARSKKQEVRSKK